MAMLAASIVIYTLFLTLVFNKRAKPTMSNGSLCVPFITKLSIMFFSPNRATTRLGGKIHLECTSGDLLRSVFEQSRHPVSRNVAIRLNYASWFLLRCSTSPHSCMTCRHNLVGAEPSISGPLQIRRIGT